MKKKVGTGRRPEEKPERHSDEGKTSTARSLLELEGLGAEIWEGVDAQEYVDELRDEWEEE
jgi:hypothetical protein